MGKQAKQGGFYNNFRIPFAKSIAITTRCDPIDGPSCNTVLYTIVRGSLNLRTNIGGFLLPTNAKLVLHRLMNVTFQPLAWVPVVDIPANDLYPNGFLFQHTLSVSSGNLNFLEGCYHAYSPYSLTFPGQIISTGTEDYYISAYYFNAGEFRNDQSGYTHYTSVNNTVELSAYRFHDQDPIFFEQGFRFMWRNGDVNNAQGYKCIVDQGGSVVGNPTVSQVTTYAWVYVWPTGSTTSNQSE